MSERASSAVCLVRRGAGLIEELSPNRFHEIDVIRRDPTAVVWMALRNPDAATLAILPDEFSVHPLALEDVRKRGQRPKVDSYHGQHMIVLYESVADSGWVAAPSAGTAESPSSGRAAGLAEFHVFLGDRWLVSVDWHSSSAVAAARGAFEAGAGSHLDGVGEVLYTLFDAAVDSYFPTLDAMAERMDLLEDRVLAGDGGSDSLAEMLGLKRELLDLRRVLAPMREVANTLLRRDLPLVSAAGAPYYQDVYDHLVRLLEQLDLYRDLLASVMDARLTVTSNTLNSVMKRLTAITVVLMAPTLIAGIYGMNFDHMPELSWSFGYPLALGMMVVVMVGALVVFKLRNWF
jgi:magnesium transporter